MYYSLIENDICLLFDKNYRFIEYFHIIYTNTILCFKENLLNFSVYFLKFILKYIESHIDFSKIYNNSLSNFNNYNNSLIQKYVSTNDYSSFICVFNK